MPRAPQSVSPGSEGMHLFRGNEAKPPDTKIVWGPGRIQRVP